MSHSIQTVNPATAIPSTVQQANFKHLYWDVLWFGVAFGSTLSFLSVFITRLGAAGWQIGWLNAGPAVINILFTMSSGQWVQHRPLYQAIKWSALGNRLGYFLLIPIPFMFSANIQIWLVLITTLLMAIPGTAVVIAFNAMLATTVPPEFRGMVVGIRNALMAGMIMVSFLICGFILDLTSLSTGYTILFTLGAFGGLFSYFHLLKINVPEPPFFHGRPLDDHAQPGAATVLAVNVPARQSRSLRLLLNRQSKPIQSYRQVSKTFWGAMGAFFMFHFAQFFPNPIFPLFWVREANLSDGEIGWVNAVFFLFMLLASFLLEPFTKRWGNRRLTIWGAVLLALQPLIAAFGTHIVLLMVSSAAGGCVWAVLSGALANRLYELAPEDQRPTHMALYNLAMNVAMLSATMLSPFLADFSGLQEMLFLSAVLRVGSGVALAKWG